MKTKEVIKIDISNKRYMSNNEYFSMLSVSIFTTEFVFLPWIVITLGGIQGIISIILLTIIRIVVWVLLSRIFISNPRNSILEIIDKKYNKFIGNIIKAIYGIYLIFAQVSMLITTYLIISSYTLKSTPKYLIIGVILLAIFYSIQNGIHSIFKLSKLAMFIMTFVILVNVLLIGKIEYTNIFPITNGSIKNIIYTTFIITSFFSGFECSLIYTKFVKDTKAIKKIGILSIIFTQILLIIFTLIACATLGKEIIVKEKWTLFSTVSLIDTKIVSKPEVVICFICIFLILITISIYTYTTTLCINSIFKKNNNSLVNLIVVATLFILTMLISTQYTMYELLYYKQIYPILLITLLCMCYIKQNKIQDRGEN